MQKQNEEPSYARYYRQFSSNIAFSHRTLLLTAFPFILANLTLDYGREIGSFFEWFTISASGYLALYLAALIFKRIFEARKIPSGFYLVTFYFLGLIRGAVIYSVGTSLAVIDSSEASYRLLGSATYAFCVIPIATILISNFKRANHTLKELQAQTLRRTNRLNSMKLEIAEQKSELAARISGLLLPVITDLISRVNAAKSGDIGKQIAALRGTVDSVVRPLSQSVAGESRQLSDPQIQLNRASLLARLNPRAKLNVSKLFLPELSTFLLTLMCSSSLINFGGVTTGVLALLALAVSVYTILRVVKSLTKKLFLPAVPAALILLSSYLLVSGFVLVALAMLDQSLLGLAVYRLIAFNLIFGAFFFVAQSRHQLLQQSSSALAEVNEELELLNSQAKQELWIYRRRVATVLHGPVQAALYASAMRLSQSKRPSKKLIQEVNSDLQDALQALRFEQNDQIQVRQILREIIEVWSGVCEVYVHVPKNVYDAVKKNITAAESFVEIIREAVSNAAKHGGATELEVSARLQNGIIYVAISNNGKKPTKQQASSGYGTQILNELALRWSLDYTDKTVFTAEIVTTV